MDTGGRMMTRANSPVGFVLAAMGLYDINSGGCGEEQQLYVHTPLFPKITIHLDRNYYQSGVFTIVSKNFTDKSIYIKSAALNGAPLKGTSTF